MPVTWTSPSGMLKTLPPEGCTHGALDGFGGGRTRTVTVSATLSNCPSFTTSENTRSPSTDGAVNDGVAVFAPLSVTDAPEVCVHA